MNENDYLKNFRIFIGKNKPIFMKLEQVAAIIATIGILMHFGKIEQGNYICLLGLIVLTLIYYFMAFSPVITGNNDDENIVLSRMEKFQYEFYYFSLSITCVTMIFYIFTLPGWDYLIKTTVVMMIVTMTISLMQYIRKRTIMMDFQYVIRIIITVVALITLVFEEKIFTGA